MKDEPWERETVAPLAPIAAGQLGLVLNTLSGTPPVACGREQAPEYLELEATGFSLLSCCQSESCPTRWGPQNRVTLWLSRRQSVGSHLVGGPFWLNENFFWSQTQASSTKLAN